MSDRTVTERFQDRLDSDYVDELIERLSEPNILDIYRGKSFSLDQERVRPTMIPLHGRPPVLVEADRTTSAKHDAKNAKLVHKYLGSITPEQAADRRLWAHLTHTDFWSYTQARFPLKESDNTPKVVKSRWFLRERRQGLLGNAVARLWWGAHMTYAPWEQSSYFSPLRGESLGDYAYTELLFRNQNVFQGIVARRFGGSLRLRICFLEALRKRASDYGNMSGLADAVQQRVNLECSYRVLSALPLDALLETMEEHVMRAADVVRRRAAKPAAANLSPNEGS